MKKFLLTACTMLLTTAAYAGIAGTYSADKFKAYEYEGYAVSKEVSWSNEDTESWEVTVTENEDGTYSIYNLVDWESTLTATYNEADGTLVIPANSLLDEEEGYAIAGTTLDTDGLIAKLNSYGSWVPSSLCKDIKLEVKDGVISALNPMFIYIVDTSYDSYAGYIYEGYGNVFSELVLSAQAVEPQIAGVYKTISFTAYEYEGYAVSKEVSWSNEDTESWEVTVTENEDGTYSIYNLVDWESTLTATYNEADGTLVIPANSLLDEEEGYAIAGTTLDTDGLIAMLNSYGSWVPSSLCKDIKLEVKDGVISALNPMFIYIVDTSYDSYAGYIYEGYGNVFSDYAIEYTQGSSSVKSLTSSVDTPIEYYNLQGMRINNPEAGQIVIRRQGNDVTKIIIR